MRTHAVHDFLGPDGRRRRCSKLLQNLIELSRESNPHPQSFLFNITLIIIAVIFCIFLVPNLSLSFSIFDQSLLKFALSFLYLVACQFSRLHNYLCIKIFPVTSNYKCSIAKFCDCKLIKFIFISSC